MAATHGYASKPPIATAFSKSHSCNELPGMTAVDVQIRVFPETAGQRLPASLLRRNEFLLDDFLGGDCFDLFLMARRDGARNVGIGLLGLSLGRGFGLPPPHLIPVAHGRAPFVSKCQSS